ncbi:EF hand family protein [Trichomonas vaginalis G3]|uniref:EF hand family protein n=1 Tax=Trichomonas vaginalis (strain ATCC PRA-98 / G3) TaxID=412133 RepID=A2EU49_TRIV3|nr:EF-Hand calcium-binding domain-containing protein 6-related family [Trichomonas vaginalis G3]EAY03797.1 EF hand family protein [Trichomonas vaginalis G3]KAI5552626.1 EF-Hand calcium-binding domain-containing protein 6-related family [Trichomonas vaginalis G3]|eukprot:XP_001316020.1 EF hand family protein [Trichomonas vaginalis G3]
MLSPDIELYCHAIISRMKEVIRVQDLEVLTPDIDPDFRAEIKEEEFRSLVAAFPARFHPDELAALVHKYKKDKYIDFARFISDLVHPDQPIDIVITPESPKKKLPSKYEELARYLYDRCTNLSEAMAPYDKNNTGKVTADQFCRGFLGFDSAMHVFRLAVDRNTNQVDYRQLQREINTIDLKFTAQESNFAPDQIPDIVRKFVQQVNSHGIILQDVFIKLSAHTGFSDPQQFLQTLRTLKLAFTIADYQEITKAFTKEGRVDVKYFLRVANLYSQEKYVPPPPEVVIEHVKARLIDFINDRRLNIWTMFKPYDRSGNGLVPKTIFVNTLIALQFDITDREIREFVDTITVDEDKYVNYIEFAKVVYARRAVNFDETIDSVLERLRNHVIEKSVRLARCLSVYDREKSGLISTSQFIAALRRIQFTLTEKDISLIRDHYEEKKMRHFLLWRHISEDVDIQQGPVGNMSASSSNLQFSPSMREILSSSRTMTTYNTIQVSSSNPTENRPVPDNLIPVFGRIFKRTSDFGIDIADEFLRKDKLKKGRVPRAFFIETISMVNIQLSAQELSDLCQFYTCQNSTDIYYMSFLKDVDEFGTLAADTLHDDDNEEESKPEEEVKNDDYSYVPPPEECRTTRSLEKSDVPHDLESDLAQLKFGCARMHIDPIDMFKDFDKKRTGIVSKSNFARCISNSGIRLSQSIIDSLSNHFSDTKKTDNVNYLRILKAIDENANHVNYANISTDELETIKLQSHKFMERLKQQRKTIANVFDIVEDQDATMPEADFVTKVSQACPTLTNDYLRLFVKKYRAETNGMVYYMRFVNDCNKEALLF